MATRPPPRGRPKARQAHAPAIRTGRAFEFGVRSPGRTFPTTEALALCRKRTPDRNGSRESMLSIHATWRSALQRPALSLPVIRKGRCSMQEFDSTRRKLRAAAITAVLAMACTAGLVPSVGPNEAEASKGNRVKGPTLGVATKPPGSKDVRDHRGEPKARPPTVLKKLKGAYVHCTKSGQQTTLQASARPRSSWPSRYAQGGPSAEMVVARAFPTQVTSTKPLGRQRRAELLR